MPKCEFIINFFCKLTWEETLHSILSVGYVGSSYIIQQLGPDLLISDWTRGIPMGIYTQTYSDSSSLHVWYTLTLEFKASEQNGRQQFL